MEVSAVLLLSLVAVTVVMGVIIITILVIIVIIINRWYHLGRTHTHTSFCLPFFKVKIISINQQLFCILLTETLATFHSLSTIRLFSFSILTMQITPSKKCFFFNYFVHLWVLCMSGIKVKWCCVYDAHWGVIMMHITAVLLSLGKKWSVFILNSTVM